MAYLKPQSPIKSGEDHIYPLTTVDQIIMNDGKRLSGVGVYLEKPEDSESTEVDSVNADTLGGVAANEYVLKSETVENAVNAENAKNADNSTNAVNAENAENAVDAQKLGGVPASEYMRNDESVLTLTVSCDMFNKGYVHRRNGVCSVLCLANAAVTGLNSGWRTAITLLPDGFRPRMDQCFTYIDVYTGNPIKGFARINTSGYIDVFLNENFTAQHQPYLSFTYTVA